MLNNAPHLLNEPNATFKQGYLYLMEKKRTNYPRSYCCIDGWPNVEGAT